MRALALRVGALPGGQRAAAQPWAMQQLLYVSGSAIAHPATATAFARGLAAASSLTAVAVVTISSGGRCRRPGWRSHREAAGTAGRLAAAAWLLGRSCIRLLESTSPSELPSLLLLLLLLCRLSLGWQTGRCRRRTAWPQPQPSAQAELLLQSRAPPAQQCERRERYRRAVPIFCGGGGKGVKSATEVSSSRVSGEV